MTDNIPAFGPKDLRTTLGLDKLRAGATLVIDLSDQVEVSEDGTILLRETPAQKPEPEQQPVPKQTARCINVRHPDIEEMFQREDEHRALVQSLLNGPRRECPPELYAWRNYQHLTIAHNSGKELQLVELRQKGTYEGQLCGLPSLIEHHVESAQRLGQAMVLPGGNTEPFLLRPELLHGHQRREDRPAEEWFGLPGVVSAGRFSFPAPPESGESCAEFYAVWWQDAFGAPDARALQQLAAIPLAGVHVVYFGW